MALSFVASAESASSAITIPATAQVGDLAVLFDYAWVNPGPATDVTPSGWTNIAGNAAASFYRYRVTYKIVALGEPGSSVTGMAGTQNDKVMLVFRDSGGPILSVTPSTWNAPAPVNTDPGSQSVLASGGNVPLIVLGMAAIDAGTAAFSTASPAFDGTAANSQSDILAGYKLYDNSPADHTIDMGDLGSGNSLASGWLALAVAGLPYSAGIETGQFIPGDPVQFRGT